ncbi:hypothetical protein GCM10027275_12280 [Rhabdobacter roseus]|uniref:Outer membrane protein OmpA-like peptidoglycan-associated protein n=1 Tax=Rhabdobacter roseus TaxID=1655419 RepID=A0A840TI48_9BACT|nr:OmpA family protein [Rhabdobacter roseus]MBB5283144.1 outer membrane protein OmpA-like peptidoglycan-associated protein [Rhabdobacter roseus]
MRYFCLYLLLLILLPPLAEAQEAVLSRRSRELYDKAKLAWQERKLDNALLLYQKLIELEPGIPEANLRLGQLYDLHRQPDLARHHYQRAQLLLPDAPEMAMAYQWLGRDAFQRECYDSAVVYLDKAKALFPAKSNPALVVEKFATSARFAREAIRKPVRVRKRSLGDTVNFLHAQFFPVLTADNETLIFTGLTPERNENIYVAQRDGDGWEVPESISESINSANNEGTCTVSADGRTLVFTACNRTDGYGGCDLYITYKDGKKWKTPQNLGTTINSRYWESQPSLSADGRTLYFASDRPGGQGRADIWKAELTPEGEWDQPRNLGATINTPDDENAPFIHANGRTLFYASNGLPGMGGFDIFLSQQRDTTWSAPRNIGYPINTVADQVGLFITSDGRQAYYTDDRSDRGQRRSLIYTFEVPDTLRQLFTPTRYAKGKVLDQKTQQPLAATIELHDLRSQEKVSEFSSQAETGQYLAVLNRDSEYAFYVRREGYLFKSLTFTVADSVSNLRLDIPLEPIEKDRAEVLSNLFFATGSFTLDEKSKVELRQLTEFLTKNPKVRIEISGHTDDVGSDKDNLELSRQRAQAVVAYLTQAGIGAERLSAQGYGETRPRLPNSSDENRQQNRRIEWRIL